VKPDLPLRDPSAAAPALALAIGYDVAAAFEKPSE